MIHSLLSLIRHIKMIVLHSRGLGVATSHVDLGQEQFSLSITRHLNSTILYWYYLLTNSTVQTYWKASLKIESTPSDRAPAAVGQASSSFGNRQISIFNIFGRSVPIVLEADSSPRRSKQPINTTAFRKVLHRIYVAWIP